MTKERSLGIVIVNWNSGSQLRECLASLPLAASLVQWRLRVVVVDNGSSDNSLPDRADDLVLLRNADNLGFARACNQGARALGQCDAFLFLNPDTRLFKDALWKPLAALDLTPDVGIIGIALEDEFGLQARSCARFPAISHFAVQAFGLDRMCPSLGHTMKEWDHKETRRVDQVIGAFFLIRGHLFEQLDGFDERFFVYFEEVDLAWRARKAGWSSLYLAEARAFHKGGGTSDQVKAQRLFYSLRSRLAYFDKHGNVGTRIGIRFITWGLEPLSRALLLLVRRRGSELTALAQAYRMLFRGHP
jgi:N-acetylglucosaminyl-diphospho-decaprenol L-rhamnosyltransferase